MTAVAALVFSSSAAFAQDDPTSIPPARTETTTTPPPTSQPAPPPPAPDQKPQAEQKNGISGVLYGDKNRNGELDPGEAVQGEVSVFGGDTRHTTTSAADGTFAFQGLAPGTYWATYVLKDGWVVHHAQAAGDEVVVAAGTTTEVAVRAERPYSEQLRATATLDRGSYEYPAFAKIKITLTNTTDRTISAIQAGCNRPNRGNTLGNGGPEWHVFNTHGVTLAAGEQYTVAITERIREDALAAGVVTLDCDFAPNAAWITDGPSVHAEAKVTGRMGHTMIFGEDGNADQRIDADEVVSGAKVVLLDPRNGARVTERTSDSDGKVEFTGLKAGDYRAVLLGPWGFTDDSQQLVRVTAQGGTTTKFLKRGAPASLAATMKFDKPRYESHESVRVHLTITNNGGQTAERVKVIDAFYDVTTTAEQWGEVGQEGPGARIPAGESRTYSVTGTIHNFQDGKLTVWASVEHIGAADLPASVSAEAEVVQTTGDVSGVVYVDRNHNRQQDPGEAAAETVVEANGGAPYGYFRTTTDADGRYSFENIPSGDYLIGYTLAGGWIVHAESNAPQVRVRPGPAIQVTARAERPYTEVLKAAMVLDKPDYAAGDDVKIAITLSNKATYEVGNVQAACDREGNTWPVSAGWGDLREPGLTLGPGETKTITVAEKVPAELSGMNRVAVHCGFAPWVRANAEDVAIGYDWAAIPGGVGTLRGTILHDKNHNYWVDPGEPLQNTGVRLMTDREYGGIVAETVTDTDGYMFFEQVPLGTYWLQVDGPWQFEVPITAKVDVTAEGDGFHLLYVVPGPPAVPPAEDSGQGGGEGETGGALAKTGASVLGLGVLAALLVAFGIGARMIGRRRTT
ncbi:SdrD B-like domain-containing protein [Lentzea sp. NPDC051208]|uniref:SdrD B-like domain-containing protein n=1 Tax=Lentzea sp. NPDC051208 TaxID=3154642 RepID=UPI003449C561